MHMKKLASFLYTASVIFGSFCPMSMASAMHTPKAMEHVSQMQEAVMSPDIPMTFVAPMSVAPVMVSFESPPIAMAAGDCSGGNCIMMDRSQKKEIIISSVSGGEQRGTALPAIVPSLAHALASPPPPFLHLGGSSLANTIATVVLRV